MKDADMQAAKRALLLHICELLEQEGLISDEEKRRMRALVNAQGGLH